MKWFCFFVLILSKINTFAARSCTEEEFSRLISKGFPVDTNLIVSRIIQCNHWSQEIGDTSAERTKQIMEGLKRAKCGSLDEDRSAFTKLHLRNEKVSAVFARADSWNGLCE